MPRRRLHPPYPGPFDPEPDGSRVRSPLPRLAWRYRSELAPLSATLGLLVAGVVLHGFWPGWWQVVAAAAVAAGLIVGDLGHRLGLDRPVERGYAATMTAAAGLWLAGATRLGPLRRPLLALLLVGMLAGGLPWWVHRRRRAKVRVTRAMTTWAEDAAAADLPGARLQAVDVAGDGQQWTARLLLPKGRTLADALARVPKLESALGLRPRAIRMEEDPTLARRVILRVVTRDPHIRSLPLPEFSGRPTVTRPILVAVYETGEPLRVTLLRKHALFGGATGAGKSTLLNAFLATLAPAPDVLLWGIDFAGGTAVIPWQSCFGRIATTNTEARALLEDACQVIQVRNRLLVHHGRDIWEPRPEAPALVLPVDELAELIEQLPDAATYLDTIARLGRKTAVTLLVATQRPTQDALGGGALRAQLTIRICLRVTEPADGELILGRGKAKQGYRPDLLDAPGKLLAWDPPDHTRPIPAKAYTLDRRRIAAIASAADQPVPELDPDTAAALAERNAPDQPPAERATAPKGRITSAHPKRAQAPDQPPAVLSEYAGDGDPLAGLLAALREAGPRGAKVAELAHTVGRAKTWVYERLQDLHRQHQVERAGHGRWCLRTDPNQHPRERPDDHHR
jgi:S-DNA-T family DNA segregation ATPase FtsK/SpoIIIE